MQREGGGNTALKTWDTSSVALHGIHPGAPDLPVTVFDRIVLSDEKSGETPDEHEEPGDPLSLCHNLLSPEERLDRSVRDAFLSGEAGAANHRNARFPMQLLQGHDLGGYTGIDGDSERNYCVTLPRLDK